MSGGFLTQNNRGGYNGQSGSGNSQSSKRSEGVVFCKGYQRGTCQQDKDHYGNFFGNNRLMRHICGNCWLKLNTQSPHPETSDDCPLKGVEQQ